MGAVKLFPVAVLAIGLILVGAAFAAPSFAILNLSSTSGGPVTFSVSPNEASSPQSLTFSQGVSGPSQISYTVSQSWSNIQVWDGQTISLGMAFPVGDYSSAIVNLFSIGTATAVLTVGSNTYSWSQAFNAETGSGAWATINPSFSINQPNMLGTVSLKLTVTCDGSYSWDQTLPSGTVISISPSNRIQSGLSSPPSQQSFGIFGFQYAPASISFSQLLSSNMISFTLNWKSTQGISINYNVGTQSGTSGAFANSPPSASSVVTNIQNPDGSSYTVTLSLSSIVYQNTSSGITNAGHFYINTGSQWVKVTPTAVIKISVSSFPTNISFAYVEDNGSTSGASYAYIISEGLTYNIPFSNSTTISGYTAYTTHISFPSAGNYTINGYLESSTSGGGSLQLMSLTWNTTSGSGSGGGSGGGTGAPGPQVNYPVLGIGIAMMLAGAYWIRRFGL